MNVLDELLVDSEELDRELVGTVLLPYLRIERRTCEVIPLPAWDEAPTEVRVLLYLLARRAMRALQLPLGSEAASPVEIERATGIPGGSVRPALKRLLKARAVAKQGATAYIVPNYALERVREYVQPRRPRPIVRARPTPSADVRGRRTPAGGAADDRPGTRSRSIELADTMGA